MKRLRFTTLFLLLLALGVCTASAAPGDFSVQVHALVNRAGGPPVEIPVNDNSVLRSGDRLQIRVKARRGGYLYIIAYGSSHSALLLRPFSGNASDARVRAGGEAVIPAPGVYLPLDDRTGTEALYTILSDKPLDGLAKLMKRMEGAGGDLVKVAGIVRGAYPDAKQIAFRHIGRHALVGIGAVTTDMVRQYPAGGSGATAPTAPQNAGTSVTAGASGHGGASGLPVNTQLARLGTTSTAGQTQSAPATPAAALLQGPEQPGVLSAEGSMIRALDPSAGTGTPGTVPANNERAVGAQEIAGQVVSVPGGGTVLVGPGAPRPSPAAGATSPATTVAAAGSSRETKSFTSKLAGWLGFGGGSAAPRTGTSPSPGPVPASPSGAPGEGGTEKPPLTVAETGTGNAVAPSPAKPALVLSAKSPSTALSRTAPEAGGAVTAAGAGEAVGARATAAVTAGSARTANTTAVAQGTSSPGSAQASSSGGGVFGALESLLGGGAASGQGAGNTTTTAANGTGGATGRAAPVTAPTGSSGASGVAGTNTATALRPLAVSAAAVPGAAQPPSAQEGNTAGKGTSLAAASPVSAPVSNSTPGGAATVAATTPVAPGAGTGSTQAATATSHAAQQKQTGNSKGSGGGLLGMIGGWFSGGAAAGAPAAAPAAPASAAAASTSPKEVVTSPAAAGAAGSHTNASPPPLNGNGSTPVYIPGPSAAAASTVAQRGVLGGEGNRIHALLSGGASPAPTQAGTGAVAPVAPVAKVLTSPPPVSKTPPASGKLALASAAPSVSTGVAAPALAATKPQPSAELPAATAQAAASAAAVSTSTAVGQSSLDQATAAGALAQAVVLVVTPAGSGAGAVIDHAGHVLTNWHVVHGYPEVTVLLKRPGADAPDEGSPYKARVLRVNKFADLALLAIDHAPPTLPVITLARTGSLRAGDTLHAIGRPDSGVWLDAPVVVLRVKDDSAWYAGGDFLHKGDVIRARARADIDASGVPLLNRSQALVGLGSYARRGGGDLYAVSVDTIKAFLDSTGVRVAASG